MSGQSLLPTIEAFKAVAFALNLKKTLKRPTVFDAAVATGSTDRSPELLDGLDDLGRAAARRWSQDANRSEVFSSGFAERRGKQSNNAKGHPPAPRCCRIPMCCVCLTIQSCCLCLLSFDLCSQASSVPLYPRLGQAMPSQRPSQPKLTIPHSGRQKLLS